MGCERLGCPLAGMGMISVQVRSKPVALFGLPAETNLGLANDAKSPHRYLQLEPENPRPKLIRSLA
jgi:hypothetical protein